MNVVKRLLGGAEPKAPAAAKGGKPAMAQARPAGAGAVQRIWSLPAWLLYAAVLVFLSLLAGLDLTPRPRVFLKGEVASQDVTADVDFLVEDSEATRLRRLKVVEAQPPVFDLNPDRIAQVLFQALRQGGFEKLRARLACLLDQAKTSLGAAGALLDLAHPSPFGAASVGAAAVRPPLSGDKFCWYASWLYASRRQPGYSVIIPGYPADEVWLSEDGTQLILRRAFGGDEVLHESAAGNLAWHEAPQFTTASGGECFTFGAVGPDFLETWTKLFAALAEFGKGVGHIVTFATSPKEYAANIPLATWNLGKSAAMALGEAPLPSLIAKNAGWGVGWWHWSMLWIPWLSVILGSLEGKHTQTNGGNQFLQWLTLLGGDALNAFTLHTYASGAHDVMLSLWTLMNQSGPAGAPDGEDTRPRNREYGDPIIGLAVAGANTLLMK